VTALTRRLCGALASAAVLLPTAATGEIPARIVTLAPSLTEIAYAIGCGPQLVADTSYDDYPAAARRLPHVADLITLDLERLAVLQPTAVVALHDQEREADPVVSRLGIPVTYLPNRKLDDLFADIAGVGEACRRQQSAAAFARSLRVKLLQTTARARRYATHPRVLFLLDLPGFTVGKNSFLDDLIRLAGGVNVAGAINQPYPNVSAEWLLGVNPDLIIVSRATPFDGAVRRTEPWRSLRAVQRGRVYRPPSDDIVQRNGPRIIEGLSWLVATLHAPP